MLYAITLCAMAIGASEPACKQFPMDSVESCIAKAAELLINADPRKHGAVGLQVACAVIIDPDKKPDVEAHKS